VKKLPWTPKQEAVLREHFRLPPSELIKLVNAAGPKRTKCAIDTRRMKLDLVIQHRPRGSIVRLADIASRVAAEHGYSLSDLKGPRRFKGMFLARQQAMAEAYATGGYSFITIGKFFGGRDHTTALSAIRRYAPLAKPEAA
jgi:chromosomal replication initiation ATPase DnaA